MSGTVYLDVTHTVVFGFRTGIQRVVRRLVAELTAEGDRVLPVVAIGNRFHALNEAGMAALTDPAPDAAPLARGGMLRRSLIAALRRTPFYDRQQERAASRRSRERLRPLVEPDGLDAGPDDAIVLLDAFWGGTTALAAARRWRAAGAALVVVVYDLIPFTHPRFMPDAIIRTFVPRMRRALRAADGAVAISRHCAAETVRFAGANGPAVTSFRLGNDLGASVAARRRGPGEPFRYIMIGTVEPRKGHAVVLDAFERRWAAGDQARLTVVGRMGWAAPALIARFRDHLERGGRLQLEEDADDSQLANLLGRSDATIVASRIEGFGLPLVESLAAGRPVIAADIPVFHEIGGDSILYFEPESAPSLIAALESFERTPERFEADAALFVWPTWRGSAIDFRAALDRVIANPVPIGDATAEQG